MVPVPIDGLDHNGIGATRAAIRNTLCPLLVVHHARFCPAAVAFDPRGDHLADRRLLAVGLRANLNLAALKRVQRVGGSGNVKQRHRAIRPLAGQPVGAGDRRNRCDEGQTDPLGELVGDRVLPLDDRRIIRDWVGDGGRDD